MKIIVNDKDITNICIEYELSGDIEQRSRSFNVKYLYKKSAMYNEINIKAGDSVALYDETNTKIFIGIIISVDLSSSSISASFIARDVVWYLTKNKVSKAYKDTAINIATELLKEFNISIDSLESIAGIKEVISTGDKTIYDVIKEAYGEGYYIYANGEKIGVAKEAKDIVAVVSGKSNLIDFKHKASIEAMVNEVLIIDDKGNILGKVENAKDYVYGLMRETYKKEDKKDANTEAKKLLKTIENTSSIEALGNIKCMSGKGIYLVDTSIGFIGTYLITDDKHSFSGGAYKMSLSLKLMEEK